MRVVLCGAEGGDAAVRVSDEGGGIAAADAPRVFDFGLTTVGADAPAPAARGEGLGAAGFGDFGAAMARAEAGGRLAIDGLGFGLPLSRLYACYFDVRLVSLPGHGVDAFLFLRTLEGSAWREEGEEGAAAAGAAA